MKTLKKLKRNYIGSKVQQNDIVIGRVVKIRLRTLGYMWSKVFATIKLSNGETIHGWIRDPAEFNSLPIDDVRLLIQKHFGRKKPKPIKEKDQRTKWIFDEFIQEIS